MDINLSKDEIIVVLDALVEGIAFDKNADDIKEAINLAIEYVQLQIRQIMAYGFLVSQFLLVTDSMQSVVQIG